MTNQCCGLAVLQERLYYNNYIITIIIVIIILIIIIIIIIMIIVYTYSAISDRYPIAPYNDFKISHQYLTHK